MVYDDESDLDVLDPDEEDDDDVEMVESPQEKKEDPLAGPSSKEKPIIDTFDMDTATVLASFKELQPEVLLKDVYKFPEGLDPDLELPPLESAGSSATRSATPTGATTMAAIAVSASTPGRTVRSTLPSAGWCSTTVTATKSATQR